MRALKVWVPLTALVPVQPLLAVQEVAPVDDQVMVALLPAVMEVDEAVRETVATTGIVTMILADWGAVVPPDPVQVMV